MYAGGIVGCYKFTKDYECTLVNCENSGNVNAGPAGKGIGGFLFGKSDNKTQTLVLGTSDTPVQVSGSIVCGENTVAATSANLSALLCGSDAVRDNLVFNADLAK